MPYDLHGAIKIIDPAAIYTAVREGDRLIVGEWSSEVHPEKPTVAELETATVTYEQKEEETEVYEGQDNSVLAESIAQLSRKVNEMTQPMANRGWVEAHPTEDSVRFVARAKEAKGNGGNGYIFPGNPTTLIDAYKLGGQGIWSLGYKQNLLVYNQSLKLVSSMNTYATPRTDNNQFRCWDACVDEDKRLLIVACHGYNVVRVYDLDVMLAGNFVKGKPKTGGHLYDIGTTNRTSWQRADDSKNNGESGCFYNAVSVCLDPAGALLVASQYGRASKTSSNEGFVSAFNLTREKATFDSIVVSRVGTFKNQNTLVTSSFRNPYGKMRMVHGSSKVSIPTSATSSGKYGIYEVDTADPDSGNLTTLREPPVGYPLEQWRPYGQVHTPAVSLYTQISGDTIGIVAVDPDGFTYFLGADATSSDVWLDAIRFKQPMDAIEIEVEGRKFLVIADYSSHKLSLLPVPEGMGSGNENDVARNQPWVWVDLTMANAEGQPDEIPSGWRVNGLHPTGVLDAANKRIKLPIQRLTSQPYLISLNRI